MILEAIFFHSPEAAPWKSDGKFQNFSVSPILYELANFPGFSSYIDVQEVSSENPQTFPPDAWLCADWLRSSSVSLSSENQALL